MADVDYDAIGLSVANKLVGTKTLKAMQSQKAIAVVDVKGVVTVNANEDIMKLLQDEFQKHNAEPSLTDFMTIVQKIDKNFLNAISGSQPSSKLLYKTWVKTNAKFLKTLTKRSARLVKKQSARRSQGSQKKKHSLKIGLHKPERKRPPTKMVIDEAEDKRPTIRKRPAFCESPSGAVGSEVSLGSRRPPNTPASPVGLEVPLASRWPPKPPANPDSPTEACGSESGVEVVEEFWRVTGSEILDLPGGSQVLCAKCKKPIHPSDDLKVYHDYIEHVNCLLSEAMVNPALNPQDAGLRRAEVKRKRKAGKQADTEKQPFGGDEDKALEKHNRLMTIAKDLNRSGTYHGEKFRVKYEPTKIKSWLRTKHNVIIRWPATGTSTTVSFVFDEEHGTDLEFVTTLDMEMQKLIDKECP